MSRPLRIQEPDLIFHVINRGNNKQVLFSHEYEYMEYLDLLKLYKKEFAIKLYHYVLMPNHVHLLLEPTLEKTLSNFMKCLTLAHTKRFNSRKNRSGHVWQGRFKSFLVEEDSYFLQCGRYIELNPVRAKLVHHPAQYRWSSYSFHALGMKNRTLDQHPLHLDLGPTTYARMVEYRKLIEQDPTPWRQASPN